MFSLVRWRTQIERLRFKYGPRLSEYLIWLSTYRARRHLSKHAIRVLIDNSVLGNAITHETGWVSTGTKTWGGQSFDAGYAARIPVHSESANSRDYENVRFLPGIAYLANIGIITLHTSAELLDEQFRQPTGRFRGYGWLDFNVFARTPIDSIDGYVFGSIGFAALGQPSAKEEQKDRLSKKKDDLYLSLLKIMGQKNSLDAWHISTAERYGLYAFLTMDYKLLNVLERQKHLEPVKSLKTKVLTPKQFGELFGMLPIDPRIMSYNDASFFVRPDLHWPDNKRRPLGSYRKDRNK